jgi:DNA polymerase (family 10)
MSVNQQLSELFATMAALLEIKGEPVFKAIAFQKVSRLLKDMTADVRQVCEEGKLKDLEGVGASSRRIIEEFCKTGRSTDYDELMTGVPSGLPPMLNIPGLGPKTISLFWKQRNVTSLEELTKAIEAGTLTDLKGIGAKKIAQIKQGIAMLAESGGRIGIVEATQIGEALAERVRRLPGVRQADVAGSLRRRKETVGDVDIICALDDSAAAETAGQAVSDAFVKFPEVQRILGQGVTKASVVTAGGLQVDLRIVPASSFGAALQYFTGSKDHNKKLRGLAQDNGMTLNEWGLYKLDEYDKAEKKTGQAPMVKPVASRTEREIYTALGMALIPPELREDRGEIEAAMNAAASDGSVAASGKGSTTTAKETSKSAAKSAKSPQRSGVAGGLPVLISLADIRGDLHSHTTASDGASTILEMAEAAKARGYEFLGITDHSKSQVIANGLSADRLLAHVKEIHKIGGQIKGITLLAGCEVDILADGRLDFEDEILAELDYVVASPHISLRQDQDKATERLLRAIENRYVNIIGHPTGRLIGGREGLPLDFARIFKAAAESGTALEINAGYPRLDLNDLQCRSAAAAGAKISINTDAHHADGLADMIYGIDVARRGWLSKAEVINCLSLIELKMFFQKKRVG